MKRPWLSLLLGVALSLATGAVGLEEDADYQAGVEALGQRKYARARELAEKMLRRDPHHYAALALLGNVYLYGEGSVPRAYYCFRRAEQEIEKQYSAPSENSGPWRLYAEVLRERAESAQQLEHYQEACELIDKYDSLFKPKQTASKGFPMLKMGKFDEARALMQKLLNDPDQDRGHIFNNLGNVEFESDNMEKSYGYFKQIADEVGDGAGDPVYWSNTGEAARDLLRLDEAEKYYLKATEHFSEYTYSDPWGYLAELWVQQGRVPEAVEALKKMQAWRISQSAQTSQHKWAECHAHAGSVLMQMGYEEPALDIFERLIRRQDRNSGISTAPTLVEARILYQYAYALQLNCQRVRERLSYCSWSELPGLLGRWAGLEQKLREARQRTANLVVSNTGLVGFIQPYGPRALDCPSLSPACWSVFGAGPTLAAAELSLAMDKPEMAARKPYLLAIMGEAYAHDFQAAKARECLQAALAGLPGADVKLKNRCLAVLAKLQTHSGMHAEARSTIQQLMDSDPSQLRACELPLPLTIEVDGSRGASQAQSWLYRSPRCQSARGAFVLRLSGDLQVQGVLSGPDGTQLGSYTGQPRSSSSEAARSFCESFHQQAFAPIVDLSQTDIHSIDGSLGTARATDFQELLK